MAYPELIRSGTLAKLIELLAHENVDIVIDVVELIHELTDEDAGNEDEDEESAEENAEAMKILVDGLVAFTFVVHFNVLTISPFKAGKFNNGITRRQSIKIKGRGGSRPTRRIPYSW
jgi:hypothetical protein